MPPSPHAAYGATYQVRSARPEVTARTLTRLEASGSPESQKLWITFTDKDVSDEGTYRQRLAEAAATLDDHARARRAKVMGTEVVDFLDLPVPATYLEQIRALGVEVQHESRWLNAASGRASLETWRQVAALPFVRDLTFVRGGTATPPDPGRTTKPQKAPLRGGLDYGPSLGQLDEINVVAAHELGWTGAGVRIAMLDTGYYQDHAAFQIPIANGQLISQWDFVNGDAETQDEPGDPYGQHFHGTVTWSIVGGFDPTELIGAAYGADFLLAKTEDTSTEQPFEEDNWVAGMEWADENGADVISSSLGYRDWYTYEDLDGDTAVTTRGADVAASRGIVVCSAMGNEGTQDWYYLIAPADADSIISVGGAFPDGSVWDQSSHGPTADGRTKPEVIARGSGTYAAASPEDHNGEGYREFDGTSVATPLVTGAAALLLQAHPGWTPMMVREALMLTADSAQMPDNDRGWGRIDVLAALAYGPSDVGEATPSIRPRLVVSPNPATGSALVDFRNIGGGPAHLELYAPSGRLLRRLSLASTSEPFTLDLGSGAHGLIPGVYLLRLHSAASEASTKLIVR